MAPEFYLSKFKVASNSLSFKLLVTVERMSAAFADHVIAANHIWLKWLHVRSVRSEDCIVILNFPHTDIFHLRDQNRNAAKFIMVYPGTLNYHQGVDGAIRAFDLIKDQIPNAEFHIYGEGQAKPDLIQLVNELGLQNKVLLWDAVSTPEGSVDL